MLIAAIMINFRQCLIKLEQSENEFLLFMINYVIATQHVKYKQIVGTLVYDVKLNALRGLKNVIILLRPTIK